MSSLRCPAVMWASWLLWMGPLSQGCGQLPEGVEYIPTRKKGKNPMKPVGVAW